MSEDFTFREKVLTSLASSEVKIDGICDKLDGVNAHLASLNGSVSKLYARDEELKDSLHRHEIECPGLPAIKAFGLRLDTGDHPGSREVNLQIKELISIHERTIAREDERAKTNKRWRVYALPLGVIGAGAIVNFLVKVIEKIFALGDVMK